MTAAPRGQRTRLPFRAVAAVLAAFAAVLLTLGFSGGGTELVPAPAPYGPSAYESDTRPYGDDAYVGSRTPHTRPERDAGERAVPAGHALFTAADTPRIPPRPARPAPAAGHAAPAAAHMPSDLGRAPPAASST
ncbi:MULTISPECIES: hypothetical protein [Streptomyces]|uniref:Serine/threonine protein kinase n=1 Tax=Streptomyces edwardsiae TaxID=3075527 RepID=A0ABU2Q9H2_9ACTN|nr:MULTISPECIES: hypothetical protein [unclassified Streptomyces]MDT0401098.1 hypothetical protein [Streptomyces sp. DSM 41635]